VRHEAAGELGHEVRLLALVLGMKVSRIAGYLEDPPSSATWAYDVVPNLLLVEQLLRRPEVLAPGVR
jgi:hypothetical protein